jgi:hypothetical protein
MNDIFVVVSEGSDGKRKARCVRAGSVDDARQTHEEHHPDDRVVVVKSDVTSHYPGNGAQ